ncbi:condensation domain-containing protein [Rhizobium halophilum]|uniref:condensation domain-containing protein n=1 Tax=Rhizobium halophilum TaxID=2846852 RepID=UPI001EFE1F8A|nr:condensation domain-containing protein [Rhizobium halophilum]MCF6371126.1 condensation domain-containing protein [Rhizobium halophilum]
MTGSKINEARTVVEQKGRPLGAQERLLYLYSKLHHRHFCIVGKLAGEIDVHDLAEALDKVQARHIRLNYSIQDKEDGPHFLYNPREIPVKDHTLDPASTWHSVVEAELATPFNPSQAPLLRMTALREPQNQRELTLVLTFHHALADGLSAVAFLDDLVAALNSSELLPAPTRPPVEQLLPFVPPQNSSDQESISAAARPDLEEVGREPLWREFEGDVPRVASIELDADFTATLVARSKEERATVQGALGAAIAAANAARHDRDHYLVASPISVRQFAGIDPSEIGVFLTVGLVRLTAGNAVPFWDRARAFSRELRALRSKEAVALSASNLERTLPPLSSIELACGLIGLLRYDAVVSNLGVLQPRSSGPRVKLQAIWGPMVLGRIRNERMVGASTYGGILRLTESHPDHVAECLPQMIAILSQAFDL